MGFRKPGVLRVLDKVGSTILRGGIGAAKFLAGTAEEMCHPVPIGVGLTTGVLLAIALRRAARNPRTGSTVLRELRELSGPQTPELGEHLEQVYFLAKAETGLVDPSIAEIKVAERRVDRIMREYEDFVFTAEDRATYQTRLALLVVLPSEDQSSAMDLLQGRGITAPFHRSKQYHQGSGWGRERSFWDYLNGRCSFREYAQRGHFAPSRK
jgi:hypothetical protein